MLLTQFVFTIIFVIIQLLSCDEIKDDNGDDEDEALTQNDFNEAAGVSQVDNYYDRFLDRIRKGKHI